jgi:hypothetical protein
LRPPGDIRQNPWSWNALPIGDPATTITSPPAEVSPSSSTDPALRQRHARQRRREAAVGVGAAASAAGAGGLRVQVR